MEPQNIRPMQFDDLERVLAIIEGHDEDDAEEAARDYRDFGLSGQCVILRDNDIVGVSGVRAINDTDQAYKLSWTYVDSAHCGQGYGRQLLTYLLDKLRESNGRKIFVYVSDYVDESGVAVYAAAMHLYQSVGFVEEARIQNYYDTGESMSILGLVLQPGEPDAVFKSFKSPKIAFEQLFPVAETEYTYSVSWKIKRFGSSFQASDIKRLIESAYEFKAHLILISFPSNYENVSMPLFEAGFSQTGQLKDYFEVGIHEDHYVFRV